MKTDKKIIQARYREKNKLILAQKSKEYKELNKNIISEKNKEYKEKNKERVKEQNIKDNKTYREKNKNIIAQKKKEYYEANKEKIREYYRQYKLNRKKTDLIFFLKEKVRNIIYKAIKHKTAKNKSSEEILGCTYEEFKTYLESLFEDWMSWENYGLYNGTLNHGWDIDHIIALDLAKNPKELIDLNHYTNLQPLCSYRNRYIKKNNPTN